MLQQVSYLSARIQPGMTIRATAGWINSNRVLSAGLIMAAVLLFIGYIGPFLVDHDNARLGAATPRQAPSAAHLFGTDVQGRDLWTWWVLGMGQTLKVAFIAGFLGTGAGLFLGLMAGYFSGLLDSIVRTASDVAITIPAIAILVLVGAVVREMTVELMALIVAFLTWTQPTRTIRSQVLTLKERAYVHVARLNGMEGLELIFREIMPNLLPFLATQFVWAFSVAVLATVGLEALGLGPKNDVTLGMTVYWARASSAVLRNMWWWWGPPIASIAAIFITLYMLSIGLDRFANPRLRRN